LPGSNSRPSRRTARRGTRAPARAKSPKDKFAALLTVSQAVVKSLELNTILSTIAEQVRQVIAVDECTVFLLDEDRQWLRPVVCNVEAFEDEVKACRLRLGEGITGSVAQTGVGEIVNDALADARAVQVPGTPEERSALMCVPLFERERVVGVITLVRTDVTPFESEDLELVTLFAGQCSAAIANARLYEETRAGYEALRETQSQLVQSAKLNALGEMAGGVAHDFNNILAAILGRTQLLLQNVSDAETRRQLQVIEQAALDGAHAVRRVQEFTRVRQDERFETLDVNLLIVEVLELTRPAWEAGAKRRGITLTVDLDLGATVTIAGNGSELREVFTNLMLNAVDAMPWGGSLHIASVDEGEGVRVEVRDSGVGMSEETRVRVFDPFFTTKSVNGMGLGLSVAYGIVTRHRGSIDVESEPGRGTSFHLRFPIGVVAAPERVPAVLGPLPGFRVLVVDDDESVLGVMADLLRALGQNVEIALGGLAGLSLLDRQSFDVVFSDLGMPDVNGWDLALAVKRQRPETRVVLVTGWGAQLEGAAAQARGVDHVIPKPFSLDDIEQVIRSLAA
jgi:signal transduction histidine kinase